MKKFFLLPIVTLLTQFICAQESPDPCCQVVGINTTFNVVIGRNDLTGRLFAFKIGAPEIKTIKLKDPINALGDYSLITSLNGESKKYLPEKINSIRVNNTNSNYTGTGLIQFDYNNYCCNIISIEKNGTNSLINAVDKTSGEIVQFSVPHDFGETLKVRDPIYKEPSIGMAIVNSTFQSPNSQTFLFGFPIDNNVNSETEKPFTTNSWAITPIAGDNNKTLGRLQTTFPLETEWGIEIYSRSKTAVTNPNSKGKQPFYELKPGSYDFKLNDVMLVNVPIQAGKETRLKAGFLKINSDGDWQIFNQANSSLRSGTKAANLALPIGTYKIKMNGQSRVITIRDAEITEI